MIEVDTSRPICENCGKETVRAGTKFGKGLYSCPDVNCPDSMKVWYRRGSRKTNTPAHRIN